MSHAQTPEQQGAVDAWLAEIVTKSGQPADIVRDVLDRHRVRPQITLPRPHRIHVQEVSFSGRRPLKDEDGGSAGEEDFDFSWALDSGVWCLASLGKNEAGKSSVLEIILWCLRGRSGVQVDVRNWLRRVRLAFSLDGEDLVTDMYVAAGIPTGTVTAVGTGTVLVEFRGLADFENTMDAFMLDRLGLEPLRTAQAAAVADAPPITGELSWPSYASALHVNRAGLGNVLGGASNMHALPTRLLELFLGAPWASTMVAAQVAHKVVSAELAAARKRADVDAAARQAQLGELTRQLAEARTRLAAVPGAVEATADLGALYAALTDTTEAAAQAQDTVRRTREAFEDAESRRAYLAGSLTAAEEAALAKAFFHTLTPTVCPRCDTPVDRNRWEQEKHGHCSLCASDVLRNETDHDHDASNDEAASEADDLRQAVEQAQAHTDRAAASLAAARAAADRAETSRQAAVTALNIGLADPVLQSRRDRELDVARLEGAVNERQGRFAAMDATVDIDPLERDTVVLKAAHKAAHARRTAALQNVLADVNKDIADMGRDLGLDMLEKVELGTSATLTVWKGGQKQPYGRITEGEQLRLKLVTTTALLRHGFRSGVGRHPGLLLVDSPGAEEVDSEDLQRMVQDLVTLADLVPQLQVIIATARGADVVDIIPTERMRLAPAGQRLW